MCLAVSLLHLSWIALIGLACQSQALLVDTDQLAAYSARMQPTPQEEGPAEEAPKEQTPAEQVTEEQPPADVSDARLVGRIIQDPEVSGFSASLAERLRKQVADPELAKQRALEELETATTRIESEPLKLLIAHVETIERPRKLRLTLDEALRRTLANNFAIRISSYNPAIATTRVVEAEALFDAAFFTNLTNNKVDRPTANLLETADLSELSDDGTGLSSLSISRGVQEQTFSIRSGVRKLLPTGMQVETSYSAQRTSTNTAFQGISPVWFDQFVVQFRQPLLRGFGLDFNRSQIRLYKLGRRQAAQEFRRQVRDVLRQTEEVYWRLAQARGSLVIAAKLLADFEQIYNFLYERRDFDVYKIQLADAKARLERSKADFAQRIADVRNAEDQLIAIINDPEVDLADDIEIIPVDVPNYQQLVIDRVAEVQTALENRAEIVEAKLAIDGAKIQVGVAKNQTQPQLDVTFRYAVDGLGASHEDAFDQVTMNDFTEYYIGLDFELPVGNRARRAALHRSKLEYAQAIAALKQTFEQVILDVNVAVRKVQVNYDQIEPSLRSAEASADQVASIIARAEKKDFLTLNTELNTRQTLAQGRAALLSALTEYAIAVVDLERAKGTLLRYNNIELVFDDADDPAY